MERENFIYFFSENVKYFRRKYDLLQKQYADRLGIKRSLLGAIEEGRTLSIETVYKVSRLHNVSIDDLLTTLIKIK